MLLALAGSTIVTALSIVGGAAGLGALLFVGGLRAALAATREAFASIRDAFEEEQRGREADKTRAKEELEAVRKQCADEMAELKNRVELLQSAWVTEIAVEIGAAVSTAIPAAAAAVRRQQRAKGAQGG